MKISTGRFVWFEYVTREQAKAEAFYGELFGWKTQSMPAPGGTTYTMFTAREQMLGGIMPTPPGAPSEGHWISHLQVEDARRTASHVQALGGKVLRAPEKVGEFGTMAIVADPLGGVFALWQPAKAEGSGDYKGEPNTWCWNELYTADPAKSVAFYSQIGGFTESKMDMPTGTYHLLEADGQPRAGVTEPPAPMPQAWMPYVQVENVDRTVAKAKQLGATIRVAGEDVPGVGRIAIFTDPQGGWLGLLTPAQKP